MNISINDSYHWAAQKQTKNKYAWFIEWFFYHIIHYHRFVWLSHIIQISMPYQKGIVKTRHLGLRYTPIPFCFRGASQTLCYVPSCCLLRSMNVVIKTLNETILFKDLLKTISLKQDNLIIEGGIYMSTNLTRSSLLKDFKLLSKLKALLYSKL